MRTTGGKKNSVEFVDFLKNKCSEYHQALYYLNSDNPAEIKNKTFTDQEIMTKFKRHTVTYLKKILEEVKDVLILILA